MKPIIIGIAGGTGSGKSTFTNRLRDAFGEQVSVILVLFDERLRDLLDIKVFVDADADERILRRILRDTKERGRDIEGIITQYLTTVKPMHNLYVEPTKVFADIITNSGMNDVAFDLMRGKIQVLLEESSGK